LASLLEAFEVTPGSLESCITELKEGHILAISPGGVREALFSDHNYKLVWGTRVGFARVAVEAKVVRIKNENERKVIITLISKFVVDFSISPLYQCLLKTAGKQSEP
jgi:hypothetical protein